MARKSDGRDLFNTNHEDAQSIRQYGKIEGWLQALFSFREDDIKYSVARFDRAIDEEWELVYATTSGAHGWQITSYTSDGERADADDQDVDPEAPTHLEEGAYCDDIHWAVFENGWIHVNPGRWLYDEHVVERVQSFKGHARDNDERAIEKQQEAVEADDDVVYATDYAGRELRGYATHEPSCVEGVTADVLNFSKGYRVGDGSCCVEVESKTEVEITVETPMQTVTEVLLPGEKHEIKHDGSIVVTVSHFDASEEKSGTLGGSGS